MLQSPVFLLVVAVGPWLVRAVGERWRPHLIAALSLAVLVAVDPSTLAAVALAGLVFVQASPRQWHAVGAIVALLALRPLRAAAEAGLMGALAVGVPLGVSYVGFRVLSVELDRRRGIAVPSDPARSLAWITFFPIWSAGPIERYDTWEKGLAQPSTTDDYVAGWQRVFVGLAKKALVVELGLFAAAAWVRDGRTFDAFSTPEAWAYVALIFLGGWLDFSAYSDVAIGAGRAFGFRISENFNWPIVATNLPEFWRRWHMTLMAFCQRSIYMPAIAWTRSPYLASFATFGLMGLWHGPSWNWLAWGLYHATGMTLYVALSRTWSTRRWPWLTGRSKMAVGWLATMAFLLGASALGGTSDDGLAAGLTLLARMWGG